MNYKIMYVAALLLTFGITALTLTKLIPWLKSRKMGQTILEIGPRWHKSKEGTPTMGGLSFIVATVLVGGAGSVYLALTDGIRAALPLIMTLLLGVSGGIIGAIDDWAKLRKKQNEGLTAIQKLTLQLVASGLYVLSLALSAKPSTSLYLPFIGVELELGVFYYIFAVLLIAGMMNAVNITDGIDGLCSSTTLVVGLFFTAMGLMTSLAEPDGAMLLLGAVLVGSCGGFLVYNFYPARVFMGDTGSLFLGAMVVGGAFMMNKPLIILVVGIVYIIEILSVVLQVSYFKLTHGKRLFKMSPIHHHFEKSGWTENKIVAAATAVTLAVSVISVIFA